MRDKNLSNKVKNNNARINMHQSEISVGLDLGSTKVCAVIAARESQPESLKILGIGITESTGINHGKIVYIDKTVGTIEKAIEQAEQQAGIKISEIVVGVSGDHIESFQTRGIVGISGNSGEITIKDVERLLEDTRKVSIPSERKIIHLIPQDYIIDGQEGFTDPIGMSGVRMEANVHVVTGSTTVIQNIYKCAERAELNVKDIILSPIASSHAILTEEEKEVGVALIDIGGGTTDIAIFQENVLRWTSSFGIAGKHVTDDIRHGLSIIYSQAERVKKEYGHACTNSILNNELFMIPGISGRKPIEVTRKMLCDIIQPRMEEIFEFIYAELKRSGYSARLGAGAVITGGTSLLRGAEELGSEIMGMPVKLGVPSGISYSGLGPEVESPIFSTAVGLALNDFKNSIKSNNGNEDTAIHEEVLIKPKIKLFNKMKKFIEEL